MLVRVLLRSGVLTPQEVWAANRSQAKVDALASEFPGIHIANSKQLAAKCDLIFLCVSAANVTVALAQMNGELHPAQLLVTTAAAIPLTMLENRVPCRVAKLIPSITQEIRAGVALLMYGTRFTPEDRNLLENLLRHMSRPVAITESLARPVIGLTSGGPALLAYLLQSMADEAVRSNAELSPILARELVQETAHATTRLFSEANMTTEEIIRRVAVPGGMTALALEILSQHVPEAWQTVFRKTGERETKARESFVL